MNDPTTPNDTRHVVADIDAAALHARTAIGPRPRRSRWATLALVLAVGGVAFAAGKLLGDRHADQPASTTAAASSSTAQDAKQLWTCAMHPQVIQDHPGACPICHMELTPLSSGSAHSDGGAVTIDPVIVQNMGVRVASVASGPLVQSVRVVGYLEEPEPLHRDINLRVSGWIERLYANVDGMPVQRGQPLFDLYSPELTVAIDELIAARKQVERAPDDATTRSLIESSRRKLAQFGLEPSQIDELAKLDAAPKTVPILAPLDGHLTAKMVYEGAAVKAGDLVMRLASRHEMWIDAQVHEQQMSLISDGQPAKATVVSQPGRTYSGKVLFVHPHVDPQTRTALVRIQIDNADLTLRQGMYATVDIAADSYREATVVPREAILDTGRRQLVFLSLGNGRFAPREVQTGLAGQNDTVEILTGLQPGEQVVTSGQFLIDSESRLREAVAKHLGKGLASPATSTPTPAQTIAAAPRPVAPPATQATAAATLDVPHASQIVQEYLAIAQTLGARQEAETPIDVAPLIDLATMASHHAGTDEPKALLNAIAQAASAMRGKPRAEQREAFVALSKATVDLVHRTKLANVADATTLYVVHCPMAFTAAGADWIQTDETIANPYYATEMKRCGEIVEQIPVRK